MRRFGCFCAFALLLAAAAYADETDFEAMYAKYADKVEYDSEGKIAKVTSWDGTVDEFFYNPGGGKLSRIETYSKAGKSLGSTVFFRDSRDGKLLFFMKGGSSSHFAHTDAGNDLFMKAGKDGFDIYNTFFSSLVFSSDEPLRYSFTEDGLLNVEGDDGSSVDYDAKGRIVRDGNVKYIYDEESGELDRTEEFEGETLKCRTKYSGFFAEEIEVFENGKTLKKIYLDPAGKTEEYFEDGVLYARAVFFPDDKRVKSIEYV